MVWATNLSQLTYLMSYLGDLHLNGEVPRTLQRNLQKPSMYLEVNALLHFKSHIQGFANSCWTDSI